RVTTATSSPGHSRTRTTSPSAPSTNDSTAATCPRRACCGTCHATPPTSTSSGSTDSEARGDNDTAAKRSIEYTRKTLDREHLFPIDRTPVESLRILLRLRDESFTGTFRQTALPTAVDRLPRCDAHRPATHARARGHIAR